MIGQHNLLQHSVEKIRGFVAPYAGTMGSASWPGKAGRFDAALSYGVADVASTRQ
jgi:hypothetical protein